MLLPSLHEMEGSCPIFPSPCCSSARASCGGESLLEGLLLALVSSQMKMLLSGEGVKVAPLAEVWVAPSSFLCLGRRPILGECCIPEDGQASIDLFP